MNRAAIESALLEWMGEAKAFAHRDPARFDALALALFRVQYAACEPYARYCRALSRTPDDVEVSDAIPAVPTGAFKEFDLRGFPAERTLRTFRTSGTSTERRGALHLDRLDLYEASLLASLRHALLPGWPAGTACMRILAPDPRSAPDSSLSHMFGTLLGAEGGPGSGFDFATGDLDRAGLRRAIEGAIANARPVLLAGTAFAFVHWLDAEDATPIALPEGSRIMETGGFKGRSREVPREKLHALLGESFGVPPHRVVNQYGMTELGSQFYDATVIDPTGPRRKLVPPWVRVRLLDPATNAPVATGEVGVIEILDLANTGSVAAILTADLGRTVVDEAGDVLGFDVLGRAEGAEARGCSIAADAMLEAARGGPA